MKAQSLTQSIQHAIDGLRYVYRTGRNFRIQIIIGILAIVAGAAYGITTVEWLFVLSAIFRVLGQESVNTSVEMLADECEQRKDIDIKNIKDTSAAYVLLSAIYSTVVGAVIFLPHFLATFPEAFRAFLSILY
ncbi:MAG: diacylglycerol kinase family protein [Actinobacteria bacterium]|nr:diacylglycerol kinase family protein [Actinomycetota bacterium]